MEISPLHPLFMGEVTGLDLGDAMDDGLLAELTAALDSYGALVFRGQSLDDAAQMRFSQRVMPEIPVSDQSPPCSHGPMNMR